MTFDNGNILMHRNCGLRGVIGSVAHIQRRCSCYVPTSSERDPAGMTRRQAADAAVAAWEEIQSSDGTLLFAQGCNW